MTADIQPRARAALAAVLLVCGDPVAAAQSAAAETGPPGPPTAVGTRLHVELSWTGEIFLPAVGEPPAELVYIDDLEAIAHLDLGSETGLEGLGARLHLEANHGETLSGRLGELQGASGLEAPAGVRVYEAWLEREIVEERLAVLAGVVDLNAEFDVLPAAGWLIHSSFGLGAELGLSGGGGASTYPSTSWGARLQGRTGGGVLLSAGAFDAVAGVPGGLVLLEAGVRTPRRRTDTGPAPMRRRSGRGRATRPVHSKFAAGLWAYTERRPALEGDGRRRAWGTYALAEHRLLGGSGSGFGGISGFARGGWARPAANRVAVYVGAGITADAPLPGRPDDVLSIGVAHARNGDPFLRATREELPGAPRPHRAETALEVTYAIRLGPVELQPDLQWIVHPGTARGRPNLVLPGLRARASWEAMP